MFDEGIFGNRKEYGPFAELIKLRRVEFSNAKVEVYFSPEDKIGDVITEYIRKAEKSIRFMAFSFTSEKISEAMIKKFHEGKDVKGIFERRASNTAYSEYTKMRIDGLPVKLDKNRANMHHKVIIIDEEIVITGSFNFSKNADKINDENIIIIKNKVLAEKFLEEFFRLFN